MKTSRKILGRATAEEALYASEKVAAVKTDKGKKDSGFLKSAAFLTLGGIVAKALGALYRIPLTNMLGAYGIGMYQLAFPLYALLVTLSAAGIPAAVAKAVAEKSERGDEAGARASFKCAALTLTVTGFLFGGALFLLARPLGELQKSRELEIAYRIIAGAIPAECISAAFKGWFHGKMNMKPTALSQIIEQVVKMTVGLIAVRLCLPDVTKAVYAAVLAVTASELSGLIAMSLIYLKRERLPADIGNRAVFVDVKKELKELLTSALPMTLSAMVLPVAHLIDSVMMGSLLAWENSTELYGLWSGPVHSLITMPSMLITGVAASVLPSMARSQAAGDDKGVSDKFNASLSLAFAVALPAALGLALLPEEICGLLYPDFSSENVAVFSKLLILGSGSIVFMSVLMTCNSVLQANGKLYIPVLALTLGSAVKCVMDFFLYRVPSVGIYEEGISHCVCNFVACFVNMWYIKHKLGLKADWTDVLFRPLAAAMVMTVFIVAVKRLAVESVQGKIGWLIVILGAGAIYCSVLCVMWRNKIAELFMRRKKLKKEEVP